MITDALMSLLNGVLDMLPDSPFLFLQELGNSQFGDWLGYLNWFVPVYSWVGLTSAWLTALGLWYVVAIFLRWLRAIE